MHLLYVGFDPSGNAADNFGKAHFSDQEAESSEAPEKRKKYLGKYYSVHLQSDRALSSGGPAARWPLLFQAFWQTGFKFLSRSWKEYLVFREGDEALRHRCGFLSDWNPRLSGESQVLGQLKQAFLTAQDAGTTGIVLNQAFKQALTFAKRMHDSYRSMTGPFLSVLTAIQELDRLGLDYSTKKVAVIGLERLVSW